MPSERHINRQIEWREALQKYTSVSLEHAIYIKGARVVVDVYVESEGRMFLIEIGNIDDKKKALMEYHAEANPNISFIHEPYDSTSLIPHVLESIKAYRKSPEYTKWKEARLERDLFLKLTEKKAAAVGFTILHILFSTFLMWLHQAFGMLWLILGLIVISLWYVSKRDQIKRNHIEKRRRDDRRYISKTLRARGIPTAVPTGRIRTIEDVRTLFPENLENMLMFEEVGEYIVIEPRQYLGSGNFFKIASIVRGEGGEYISAGKESHFRVPKKIS